MGGSSKGHIQMGGSSKGLLQMGGSDFDKCTGVHPLTDGRFQYRPFLDGRFDLGRSRSSGGLCRGCKNPRAHLRGGVNRPVWLFTGANRVFTPHIKCSHLVLTL